MKYFASFTLLILLFCNCSKPEFSEVWAKSVIDKYNTDNEEVKKTKLENFSKYSKTASLEFENKKYNNSLANALKAIEFYANGDLFYTVGNSYLNLNQPDSAKKAFLNSVNFGYSKPHLALYNVACINSLNNRIEEGFLYLNLAVEKGYSNFSHISKDSDLKNLKEDPLWDYKFQRLLIMQIANQRSKLSQSDFTADNLELPVYEELRKILISDSLDLDSFKNFIKDHKFKDWINKLDYTSYLFYEDRDNEGSPNPDLILIFKNGKLVALMHRGGLKVIKNISFDLEKGKFNRGFQFIFFGNITAEFLREFDKEYSETLKNSG